MKYDVFIDHIVLRGHIEVEANSREEAEAKSKKIFDSMLKRSKRWGVHLDVNKDSCNYIKWYAHGMPYGDEE